MGVSVLLLVVGRSCTTSCRTGRRRRFAGPVGRRSGSRSTRPSTGARHADQGAPAARTPSRLARRRPRRHRRGGARRSRSAVRAGGRADRRVFRHRGERPRLSARGTGCCSASSARCSRRTAGGVSRDQVLVACRVGVLLVHRHRVPVPDLGRHLHREHVARHGWSGAMVLSGSPLGSRTAGRSQRRRACAAGLRSRRRRRSRCSPSAC